MSWIITDLDATTIRITQVENDLRYDIPKFNITMYVEEPYLTIVWHKYQDTHTQRQLTIDYNDVTSPVVASATALETVLDGYIISGWTNAGGIADGDYGDITVGGSGTTMTIDNDAVTYAKMQDVSATDKLLGRVSAGPGNVEEVTLDPDGTLAANSDDIVASQKAVKTYVDAVPEYFNLMLNHGLTSPNDATAIYFGWRYGLGGEGAKFNNPAIVPLNCEIVKVQMTWRAATGSAAGDVRDFYVSVWTNAVPPVLISDTIALSTNLVVGADLNGWAESGALTIAASAGNLIWMHYVGPYATNPINLSLNALLTCKRT